MTRLASASGVRQRRFFGKRVEQRLDPFVGVVLDDATSVLEFDDIVVRYSSLCKSLHT
jgi:hypothetical protein